MTRSVGFRKGWTGGRGVAVQTQATLLWGAAAADALATFLAEVHGATSRSAYGLLSGSSSPASDAHAVMDRRASARHQKAYPSENKTRGMKPVPRKIISMFSAL